MDCTIVRLEAGSDIQLLGVAIAEVPTRIHYILTVARSGQRSEATLSEIGDVDVPPNVPTEFAHTRLPFRPEVPLDAHLIVTWDQGSIECDLVQAPDDTA